MSCCAVWYWPFKSTNGALSFGLMECENGFIFEIAYALPRLCRQNDKDVFFFLVGFALEPPEEEKNNRPKKKIWTSKEQEQHVNKTSDLRRMSTNYGEVNTSTGWTRMIRMWWQTKYHLIHLKTVMFLILWLSYAHRLRRRRWRWQRYAVNHIYCQTLSNQLSRL